MAPAPPELLDTLAEKYRELRALRVEHAAGEEGEPRERLALLAARFPGALRELDRLPLEIIEGRLAALERAVRGEGHAPAWAGLQLAYHGWLRVVLRLKRGLDPGSPEIAFERARQAYRPALDEPGLDLLDASVLEALLRPPGGRLSRWVVARVAADHAVDEAAVEAALFDFPP